MVKGNGAIDQNHPPNVWRNPKWLFSLLRCHVVLAKGAHRERLSKSAAERGIAAKQMSSNLRTHIPSSQSLRNKCPPLNCRFTGSSTIRCKPGGGQNLTAARWGCVIIYFNCAAATVSMNTASLTNPASFPSIGSSTTWIYSPVSPAQICQQLCRRVEALQPMPLLNEFALCC